MFGIKSVNTVATGGQPPDGVPPLRYFGVVPLSTILLFLNLRRLLHSDFYTKACPWKQYVGGACCRFAGPSLVWVLSTHRFQGKSI